MAEATSNPNRGIYGILIAVVVAGIAVGVYMSLTVEPGEGIFEPNAVILGLVAVAVFNSLVLLILLFTLRRAVQVIKEAEVARMSATEEKQHVILIEGIGAKYAARLNQHGIITIPQLLAVNPQEIAPKIDATPELVKDWQAMAILMEVKGIGPQYAEILVLAGVKTIGELARSTPAELTAKIDAIEARRKTAVLGHDVTQAHVTRWINAAKEYLQSHTRPTGVVQAA